MFIVTMLVGWPSIVSLMCSNITEPMASSWLRSRLTILTSLPSSSVSSMAMPLSYNLYFRFHISDLTMMATNATVAVINIVIQNAFQYLPLLVSIQCLISWQKTKQQKSIRPQRPMTISRMVLMAFMAVARCIRVCRCQAKIPRRGSSIRPCRWSSASPASRRRCPYPR